MTSKSVAGIQTGYFLVRLACPGQLEQTYVLRRVLGSYEDALREIELWYSQLMNGLEMR